MAGSGLAGGQGMPTMAAEKLGCHGSWGECGHTGKGEGQAREETDSGGGGRWAGWTQELGSVGLAHGSRQGHGGRLGQTLLPTHPRPGVWSARCCPGPGLISSGHVTLGGSNSICLCPPQSSAHRQSPVSIDCLLCLVL